MQRCMRVLQFLLHRRCGFEHGAVAFGGGGVERAGLVILLQHLARLVPFAGRGVMLEERRSRPRKGRDLVRLLGEMMRGFRIGASRRLDVQPAQPEKPRRGIERHLLEGGLRLAEIAFDLSRLRLEIMDERLIGQKLFRCLCGVLPPPRRLRPRRQCPWSRRQFLSRAGANANFAGDAAAF